MWIVKSSASWVRLPRVFAGVRQATALSVAFLLGALSLPMLAQCEEAAERLFDRGETVPAPQARARMIQAALDTLAEALIAARAIGKGEPDEQHELQ